MKEKIIIALDVENFENAKTLVDQLSDAEIFKVGLQSFLQFGNELISYLKVKKKKIFLDLKFKDIPNTVYGAVKSSLNYSPYFLTIHLSGGSEMIKKALDILLIGKFFDQFFKSYYDLSKKAKKIYLRNKFQIILDKLKTIVKERDFEQVEDIFVNLISIFREQLLYEQSKEISEFFVDSIKAEALDIVKNSSKKDIIKNVKEVDFRSGELVYRIKED